MKIINLFLLNSKKFQINEIHWNILQKASNLIIFSLLLFLKDLKDDVWVWVIALKYKKIVQRKRRLHLNVEKRYFKFKTKRKHNIEKNICRSMNFLPWVQFQWDYYYCYNLLWQFLSYSTLYAKSTVLYILYSKL